jgi:CRP-like cAMP-binding protein
VSGAKSGHGERPPGRGDRPSSSPYFEADDIAAAWRASFMADLAPATVDRLLVGAHIMTFAPDEVFYRGDRHSDTQLVGLVISGLVRIYATHDDGRQVTFRYARPGDVVGVPPIGLWRNNVGHGWQESVRFPAWIEGEAIEATRVLRMDPNVFRLAASEAHDVAWALAQHTSELAMQGMTMLIADIFLPVRCRVALHLLDLASREDATLVVRASNQDIAEAIGSVREVVSRVLAQMKAVGLIDRADDRIVLLDPASLHRVARGQRDLGDKAPARS